ncbi:hypothetical protein SEEHN189_09344, partial [Salmonella enterica subsp. enterica serovar Heidelberg str. N189]
TNRSSSPGCWSVRYLASRCFRGVPVGPLIAAGLVSLIVGKQ